MIPNQVNINEHITSATKIDAYSTALDALRAIAVMSVIANHFYEKLIPSGYLGVDIFFVISGFVIASSLVRRNEKSAKAFFIGFYKRRIKRLLPALLLFFCTTALLISFFSRSSNVYITTGLFSILGVSNIRLYFNAVDYWGESAKLNPFTHTWSLGVEEQFYMIFPFIVWLIAQRNWSKSALNQFKFLLLILCSISLTAFIVFSNSSPMAVYFLMPFRFWEISLGCLLYVHLKTTNWNLLKRIVCKIPTQLLLLIILTILFLPKDYSTITTIAIVFFTLLLIIHIKSDEEKLNRVNSKFLASNTFVYLGKISYSLYLWHWVVLVISRWTIGVNKFTIPIQIILIFFVSILSYNFIEQPLRHMNWRQNLRPKLILVPLLVVATFFIYLIKFSAYPNLLYLGSKETPQSAVLNPDLISGKTKAKCSKMRIIGNSHSLHIVPMLSIIAEKFNIELIHEEHPNYILIPNGDRTDIDKLDQVLSVLNKNDLLILSSRYRYLYEIPYLNGQGDEWIDHAQIKEEKGYGLDVWLLELDKVIAKANQSGVNVILFLPNIEFDKQVFNSEEICNEEWFRFPSGECNPKVSKKFLNSRFPKKFYDEVKRRVNHHTNFFAFDPQAIYCPNSDECSRIVNGVVAFKDTNHLTPEGAKLMLNDFYTFLIDEKLL